MEMNVERVSFIHGLPNGELHEAVCETTFKHCGCCTEDEFLTGPHHIDMPRLSAWVLASDAYLIICDDGSGSLYRVPDNWQALSLCGCPVYFADHRKFDTIGEWDNWKELYDLIERHEV
jgi:hypothetical protein